MKGGKQINDKSIFFNHYKVNEKNVDTFNSVKNINKNIKSHIHKNSKNYIKNEYL